MRFKTASGVLNHKTYRNIVIMKPQQIGVYLDLYNYNLT